jgi:hypothetical protein
VLIIDGGTPVIDTGIADAAGCADFCDACDEIQNICTVDCSGSNCDNGIDITCPPGWTCAIECIGTDACRGGGAVNCDGTCEIICAGTVACENLPVTCSGDFCSIVCEGTDACDSAVRCNASDCDITCDGTGACEDDGTCCNGGSCGGQCTELNGGNCSCPL